MLRSSPKTLRTILMAGALVTVAATFVTPTYEGKILGAALALAMGLFATWADYAARNIPVGGFRGQPRTRSIVRIAMGGALAVTVATFICPLYGLKIVGALCAMALAIGATVVDNYTRATYTAMAPEVEAITAVTVTDEVAETLAEVETEAHVGA